MPREDQRKVLIVAAGKWAYFCFHQYAAYVCQANRSFRSDINRLGYYADGEIEPEFPRIFLRRGRVPVTLEHAAALRALQTWQDAAFATVIERLMADGRDDGSASQIFLLSAPSDLETLRISRPIQNVAKGQGRAWTQGHRYVSEDAIRAEPSTTSELAGLMEMNSVDLVPDGRP